MHTYYVYILASASRTLYVGVTRDLVARLYQHRHGQPGSFTSRHDVTQLVYFETTDSIVSAITREMQLKRWPRWRKVRLIELENAGWRDLAADWYDDDARPGYDAPGNP